MSLVEITICNKGRSASFSASQVASICSRLNPLRAATSTSWSSRASNSTALKSPCDVNGNPASITSTFKRASCLPISNFSSTVSAPPAACSPSRNVVSKMRTCRIATSSSVQNGAVIHCDRKRPQEAPSAIGRGREARVCA